MAEKKYPLAVTALKTGTPMLFVIISEALHAAAVASGIDVDIGATYATVTTVYAAVTGLINWIKNRKKKESTAKTNYD